MTGFVPTGSISLGIVLVKGSIRVPYQAAKIIAFMFDTKYKSSIYILI